MNRETVDRFCELGILGLVLAIVILGPLALGAVEPGHFLVLQGFTVMVLLLWVIRLWAAPRPVLLFPPVCWFVLAFVGFVVWRYFTSDVEYIARQEMIRILTYAVLFFAILNNLHRQESTQIITFTLLVVAMAISFYALYQFLSGSDRVWSYVTPYKHRGTGTYINPNHFAGFVEMLLPLGLAYTLTGRSKHVTRILLGYVSLVLMAGITVSLSRGSWLSSAISLAALFPVLASDRRYRLGLMGLLVVVLALGVFIVPRSSLIKMRAKRMTAEPGKVNDELRFAMWRPAVRIWQENVWTGAGLAHFDVRYRMFRPERVQRQADRAHNDYLNALADWGIVGSALAAGVWLALAWGVAKSWPFVRRTTGEIGKNKGSNRFAFVLGASAGLLALLLHSFVDFNFHIPANAILAVTLTALLSSHLRFATESFWFSIRTWLKVPLTLMLVLAGAYLALQGVRRAGETYWLLRAALAPNYSPQKIDLLKHAYAAEPMNPQTVQEIGECYRVRSSEGLEDYATEANEALQWFGRAMKLNRWEGYAYLGCGRCLDWLGRQEEAAAYFTRAEELDPNGYFTVAHVGIHYVALGNYPAAKTWFERSARLNWVDNPIPRTYLRIVQERMLEASTNSPSMTLKRSFP